MTENEWQNLSERLTAIENAAKEKPRSLWQSVFVPVITWLAAIAAAFLTAWFTARMAGTQERQVFIAKNDVELYGQLVILREKVFVGFERFIKTKGRYDKEAEEASEKLLSILDTQQHVLPVELEQALRGLNTYVNKEKADLLKVPKPQWNDKAREMFNGAVKENDAAQAKLADWYTRLKSG